MSKPNIFRRIGMRVLLWILGDEQQSRTCELNRVLYERSADGRSLSRFSHPQVEVGEHTYGLQRECFIAYHPDDRVQIGKYCSIGDGVRFVFGEHRTDRVTTFPLRAICFNEAPHADALSKGDIVVGNDVWIGAGAIILSGVKIGNGAIIGCRGSCRQRCAALLNRWRRAGKGDKNAPLRSPNCCAGENSVVELAERESSSQPGRLLRGC